MLCRRSCLCLLNRATTAGYSVTAEAAGSSPVVPAIFFKHLQEINKTNLGPFGSNKQFPPYWTSFDLLAKNKPVGKIAPTSLSCAIRLLSAVACRYLLVTCRLLCRR